MSWNTILLTLAVAAVSYLLGSINFAILFTRAFKKQDIRNFGSGNAGMTNVLRTFGKPLAVLTFLGDFLKGLLSALLGGLVYSLILSLPYETGAFLAGIGALLGHIFPIFYKFKGGKGVLTSAAVIVAINPLSFTAVVVVFLIMVVSFKMVSLASVSAALLFPGITAVFGILREGFSLSSFVFSVIFSSIVIYMHRSNLARIVNGTEHKFGKKKESGRD